MFVYVFLMCHDSPLFPRYQQKLNSAVCQVLPSQNCLIKVAKESSCIENLLDCPSVRLSTCLSVCLSALLSASAPRCAECCSACRRSLVSGANGVPARLCKDSRQIEPLPSVPQDDACHLALEWNDGCRRRCLQ